MKWIKWLFDRSKPEPERLPVKEHGIVSSCPACGYTADEFEFLSNDSEDTRCPRCGEDTTNYEI